MYKTLKVKQEIRLLVFETILTDDTLYISNESGIRKLRR